MKTFSLLYHATCNAFYDFKPPRDNYNLIRFLYRIAKKLTTESQRSTEDL
jgi:hypothetical protein